MENTVEVGWSATLWFANGTTERAPVDQLLPYAGIVVINVDNGTVRHRLAGFPYYHITTSDGRLIYSMYGDYETRGLSYVWLFDNLSFFKWDGKHPKGVVMEGAVVDERLYDKITRAAMADTSWRQPK